MKTSKNIECVSGFKIFYIVLFIMVMSIFQACTKSEGDQPYVEMPNSLDTIKEYFLKVEFMPQFPHQECENLTTYSLKEECAKKKLLEFIYDNLKYPLEAKIAKVEGTTTVQFIVRKNGEVSDIKVVRDIGYGCGEETHRVIQLMNDEKILWHPGIHNGQNVNILYTLPIRFKL